MTGSSEDRALLRQRSRDRFDRMREAVRRTGGAVVAFSAGVDSTLVLAVAREVLGDRAVALTAHSPSVPQAEREEAARLAARLGARHVVVESREGDDPRYQENSPERCYFCKSELYRLCEAERVRLGLAVVLDGFNADDRGDHRPGHRAAGERGVSSPLAEAGLGKEEVRAWSEAYGLPTWDKPQMACLASRIPYWTPVTPERLARIEAAEAAVRAYGLRQFRVRDHGDVGRLEVAADEMEHAFARREQLAEAVRAAGFRVAALDLEPFRSGRMNEVAGVRRAAGD
ncbi:MAG TPA: ATP-dependent sacrificial sulfur transferase LarE [Anaeromyxobacteraceae bacterium]|nr:ATP-dependent sacrificial sulfur transferase LarE [Anaeromyxobacteraceae bacterium]